MAKAKEGQKVDRTEVSLTDVFQDNEQYVRTGTRTRTQGTVSAGRAGLEASVKACGEFGIAVKLLVESSRKSLESIGVEIEGMQAYTTYEKFLGYVPLKGDRWKSAHRASRLKGTSLVTDVDLLMQNIEVYGQKIDAWKTRLLNGITTLEQEVTRLGDERTVAQEKLREYTGLLKTAQDELRSAEQNYSELQAKKASPQELRQAELAVQQTEATIRGHENEIMYAQTDIKTSTEQQEFAESLIKLYHPLTQSLGVEAHLLGAVADKCEKNLKGIAEGITGARLGSGGYILVDDFHKVMETGIRTLDFAVGAIVAETARSLREPTYDPELLPQTRANALGYAQTLKDAAIEIADKLEQGQAQAA